MTKLPPLGTTYVPPEGPTDTNIVLVGEAPGKDEERERRPFVGYSGQLLERYLERQGLRREEVFLTNLCRYRPKGNKFKHALDSPQLKEGLEELGSEIQRINPNIVIALGSWPLYFLTGKSGKKPGTGILNWRGSFLQAYPQFGSVKVFATVHPAFVQRAWAFNPIFNYDLGRAVADSTFPGLRYPSYESIINPDVDDLRQLVEESSQADLVSVDIETFPNGTFSCVGFCYDESFGTTVTFQRPDLHFLLRQMWEASSPKTMQFGTYDISFMRYFYGWEVGGFYDGVGHDTYVAAASLMPSFPRGLDFLTSIYTRFPYYKEERKVWKQDGDMTMLWEYNIKDVVATYQIALKQKEELKNV